MKSVEIRRADPADARSIAELHVRSFRITYGHLPVTRRSAESGLDGRVVFWEDRLSGAEGTTLLAVKDRRVVGFIHFGVSPDGDADETTGHIFSVHVDPASTGRGIGGRLVEAATKAMADDGHVVATLWVVAENTPARRLYHHLGWRPDGTGRTEKLSVGEEEGDEVEVIRFRLDLPGVVERS